MPWTGNKRGISIGVLVDSMGLPPAEAEAIVSAIETIRPENPEGAFVAVLEGAAEARDTGNAKSIIGYVLLLLTEYLRGGA